MRTWIETPCQKSCCMIWACLKDKNQHPDRRLPPDESTIIVGRAVWYGNRL
nr:MAG TPA: hypothetical protein [Caudoviricetes sp.]